MGTTGVALLALLCWLVYRLGSYVKGVRDEIHQHRKGDSLGDDEGE